MSDPDARLRAPFPDLSRVTADLEAELKRFEELVAIADRTPKTTRKSLEKAARAVTEAGASHERSAALIGAFMRTMTELREREEAFARLLVTSGQEIGARSNEMAALLQALDSLGRGAQAVSASIGAGADTAKVEAALEELGAGAATVAADARAKGFPEVERDADAIRKRVLASAKKLSANG